VVDVCDDDGVSGAMPEEREALTLPFFIAAHQDLIFILFSV
jgi:hypothetical protein